MYFQNSSHSCTYVYCTYFFHVKRTLLLFSWRYDDRTDQDEITVAAFQIKNYACHVRDVFFKTDKGDSHVRILPFPTRCDPITVFPN